MFLTSTLLGIFAIIMISYEIKHAKCLLNERKMTVPTLPGCITYGADLMEAIELYIESLVAHGEDVPTEENTLEYTVMVPAYA